MIRKMVNFGLQVVVALTVSFIIVAIIMLSTAGLQQLGKLLN